MSGRITGLLREYVLGLSIITTIIGLFLIFMGVIWYWFRDVNLGFYTDTIGIVKEWNAYVMIFGFIVFAFGFYYFYIYFKNRKFILKELDTNKRSELLKKRSELEDTVKKMPSKYQKMLQDKESELRIK